MASHSHSRPCPNCGNEADALEDSRDGSFLWCAHCGCTVQPVTSQCPLDELNERRAQWDEIDEGEFPPLEALPTWNLDS